MKISDPEDKNCKSNESLQTVKLKLSRHQSKESQGSRINCKPELYLGVNSADEIRKMARMSKCESSHDYRQVEPYPDYKVIEDLAENQKQEPPEEKNKRSSKNNNKKRPGRPRGRPPKVKRNQRKRPNQRRHDVMKNTMQMGRFDDRRVHKRRTRPTRAPKPKCKTNHGQHQKPKYDEFYVGKLRNYVNNRSNTKCNNKRNEENNKDNSKNNNNNNNNNSNNEENNNNNNNENQNENSRQMEYEE